MQTFLLRSKETLEISTDVCMLELRRPGWTYFILNYRISSKERLDVYCKLQVVDAAFSRRRSIQNEKFFKRIMTSVTKKDKKRL